MKKSLIAIALLLAASAASALSFFAPSQPVGYPVATQSVSVGHRDQAAAPVAVQAPNDVKTADSGTGAESAYQAWVTRQTAQTDCSTCRTASMHPGCGQREPHPSMAKGKKGGGGKRCIDVGSIPSGLAGRAPSST